ncbi:DUF3567 domain-containing protein [Azohydromonas sediminis]|uniref:BTH_I0359 family protein n=1 Tax=Azohydromonas sediminis TaxID=2259674 RepID=UPI000E64B3C6|nr:DUF3567 domain-containing protein [Azohydromonas sediminis]
MHMLYNSDHFAVVQFEVPADAGSDGGAATARGGYEIVDKSARREIFLEGAMARSFREGVQALIESQPSEDEIDAFLSRYTELAQQPVVLH